MQNIIEVQNLEFVYGNTKELQVKALKGVSFEVQRGEFVGVIGHTGSGKSTLLTHLNGLLKPHSGKIILNGKDIWEEPKKIRDVRFQVGLVFQYPEYQLFEETVEADIAFGPRNMGILGDELAMRVRRAAEFTGLREEILKKSPFELSGGQKRRVAIAGVMAMEPSVLILDEPTAGLDPGGREKILGQIHDYHKMSGTTVLLSSHSMEDIAKYADRILVLNDGEVLMYDKKEVVFSRRELLAKSRLSVPDVTKILMMLKERGIDINTDGYTPMQATEILLNYLDKRGLK